MLAGIAEFPAHLLHVGDQSGADWGSGNYLQALGDLGDDAATIASAGLLFAEIAPAAADALGKLGSEPNAEAKALSGCKGGEAGSGAEDVPGEPLRGKDAPERAYKLLQKYHGLDPDVASNRLHILKDQGGLSADDDVVIGRTGDVYNAATGERLGSLTDRLLGTKR